MRYDAVQLGLVKEICDQSDLDYIELAPTPLGIGVALVFGEVDFTVVSFGVGDEDRVRITSGILKSIDPTDLLDSVEERRSRGLEAANYFNRLDAEYLVVLHESASDLVLLVQQTFKFDFVWAPPKHLINACIKTLPEVAQTYRTIGDQKWSLSGQPWRSNFENYNDLLLRSLA